jgi:hypothetical protein
MCAQQQEDVPRRDNWNARCSAGESHVVGGFKRNTHAGISSTECRSASDDRGSKGDSQNVKRMLASAADLAESGKTYCPTKNKSSALPGVRYEI